MQNDNQVLYCPHCHLYRVSGSALVWSHKTDAERYAAGRAKEKQGGIMQYQSYTITKIREGN
jgi:hypothetical protein